MNETEPNLCLHCERRPRASALGLCAECRAVRGIRRLYVRRRGWSESWEAHLLRLTERAQQRLPLFEELCEPGESAHVPNDLA